MVNTRTLMTASEVGHFLGGIAAATVNHHAKLGRLPVAAVAGRTRMRLFDPDAVAVFAVRRSFPQAKLARRRPRRRAPKGSSRP